ncbi:hypothetical protein C9J41_10945 [Photobacterium sp. GB-50]|uniref:ion channel n=1 Tax=Photobacterium sp. GB-50 TaxID=2022107 RepID=UPI000D1663E8|nr:ion channel [Photobacterium sp. GB-50]PSW73715.1 hypothetical protein C9J41_10945 [Photobacterium sp. GB-50]
MYLPEKVEKTLMKLGWDTSTNIAEFWFGNRCTIAEELRRFFIDTEIQKFETQIRWKSEAGIECQKAVLAYIENRVKEIEEAANDAVKTGTWHLPEHIKTIEFSSFRFKFNGKDLSLDDFQQMYANPKISPSENLMGIDLNGIKINHCILVNTCLANANLTNAQLGSITFRDCSLNGAILVNARLGQVKFQCSSMAGADIDGAFLNVVELSDQSAPDGLSYKKVSYLYLLKCLFLAIFRSGIFSESPKNSQKHTIFLFNDTAKLTSPYNLSFKNYVDWYQYIFVQLRNFKRLPIGEKLLFSFSLIITKSWTSYAVLGIFALIANIVFALIYQVNSCGLKGFDGSFLTAFYYSVVTFTTLGYGEITPLTDFTRIIVIIEVLLGYITLGSFVFLIGHKVNDRF